MHGNGHDHGQVHGSEQDHSNEEDEEEIEEEQPEVHGAPSIWTSQKSLFYTTIIDHRMADPESFSWKGDM